ncbi:MAG: hypothetical protein AAF418_02740 [Pseudomonadota bacterium]
MLDFASARHNMVQCQLRPNHIANPHIIQMMSTVCREYFLEDAQKMQAYLDHPIALGAGRFLPSCVVIGQLLELAFAKPREQVLLVGEPCGYVAALMSGLAEMVFVVEPDHTFADHAKAKLAHSAFSNIRFVQAGLEDGYAREAPYDAILVPAGCDKLAPALAGQIANGGIAVFIKTQDISRDPDQQSLACLTAVECHAGSLSEKIIGECFAYKLPELTQPAEFRF